MDNLSFTCVLWSLFFVLQYSFLAYCCVNVKLVSFPRSRKDWLSTEDLNCFANFFVSFLKKKQIAYIIEIDKVYSNNQTLLKELNS